MPNSKKSRTHKVSPNAIGTIRGFRERTAAIHNKTLKRTPWQKQKDKRFNSTDRIAKRKRYAANAKAN